MPSQHLMRSLCPPKSITRHIPLKARAKGKPTPRIPSSLARLRNLFELWVDHGLREGGHSTSSRSACLYLESDCLPVGEQSGCAQLQFFLWSSWLRCSQRSARRRCPESVLLGRAYRVRVRQVNVIVVRPAPASIRARLLIDRISSDNVVDVKQPGREIGRSVDRIVS